MLNSQRVYRLYSVLSIKLLTYHHFNFNLDTIFSTIPGIKQQAIAHN